MEISLEEATQRVKQGEVVAVPTDTVFGLAVDPRQPLAMEALYALKGRSPDKPCVLLGASLSQLLPLCAHLPEGFTPLAETFWPGGLTLVVPTSYPVADRLDVAFRIPNCTAVRQLVQHCGPLAVPSANPSGLSPALSPEEVEAYFGKGFPVLEGSVDPCGLPSTILVFREGRWLATRLGAITLEALTAVLGYEPCGQFGEKRA